MPSCLLAASIHPWWIWAYYISPFSYSLRGIAINELTSHRWDHQW
jgi:ABC-type multidrug transport system permease subunit